MNYLHEKDLKSHLDESNEDIMAYVKGILDKDHVNADNLRKAKELSHMLRKRKKPEIAAQVAEALYANDRTPENLNLRFVAVADTGRKEEIEKLEKEAAAKIKEPETDAEQRRHLYATRLKAANRIPDNGMFERAYAEIPNEDKTGNNYIANQYYIYLNRVGRYQEIVNHYQFLDSSVRQDKRIQEHYQGALGKIGATAQDSSVFLIAPKSADLQLTELMLKALRVRVIKITGDNTSEIIKNMEADKSGSRFVFAYETAFDEFEWGYFLGKVGAFNLVLITDDKNAGNAFSAHGFEKPLILPVKWDNLDTRKKELAQPMQNSGLNVYLE